MSDRRSQMTQTFIAAAISTAAAAVIGLLSAALFGVWVGLLFAGVLLLTITMLAHKALSGATPTERIVRTACQVLLVGLTVTTAAPPFNEWIAVAAGTMLGEFGISLTALPPRTNNLPYFATFAVAITACVVAAVRGEAKSNAISPTIPAGEPADKNELIASADAIPENDRVPLGLPARGILVAATVAILTIFIYFGVTLEGSSKQIIGFVQTSLIITTLIYCINVWSAQRASNTAVRERATFWAAPLFLSLTLEAFIMSSTGISPLMGVLELTESKIKWKIDLNLELLGIATFILGPLGYLSWTVRSWRGCKSTDQYQAEERKAESAWLSECARAWRWAWNNKKWITVYRRLSNLYVTPLETPRDPLAWPLRGFELVRLKMRELDLVRPEYFPHAPYWIGNHRVSALEVVVFAGPAGAAIDDHVAHLSRHLVDLVQAPTRRIERVIVVTDTAMLSPPTMIEGRSVEWVDEQTLLATLVDFRGYVHDIRERVEKAQIANSRRTISDVYVPSSVILPDHSAGRNVEDYLNLWCAEPGRRQIALLGDFGMGKSTTALMWTYHILVLGEFDGQFLPAGFRVPIIIELRGLSPRNMTPDHLLAGWAMRYQVDANALRHLVVAGRIVLILEGFDETAFQGNEDARIAHFRSLWALAYPKSKLLFTGRPNFFINPSEREIALRLSKPLGDQPYCAAIVLQELDLAQIERALRDQRPHVRSQIVAKALNNTRFRELVSRPTILHAVTTMWEQEGLYKLPDEQLTSAHVIGLFIRHSDLREGLKEDETATYQPVLTRTERAFFMSGIASYMVARKLPNQIATHDLEQIVERLLESIPESLSMPQPPLRIRIGIDSDIRLGMHTDIRTTGLLVEDSAVANSFKFAHKSYMEYLAAEQVAAGIVDPLNAQAGAIRFVTKIDTTELIGQEEIALFCSEVLLQRTDLKSVHGRSGARLLYAVFGERGFTRAVRGALFRHWTILGIFCQKLITRPELLISVEKTKEILPLLSRAAFELLINPTQRIQSITLMMIMLATALMAMASVTGLFFSEDPSLSSDTGFAVLLLLVGGAMALLAGWWMMATRSIFRVHKLEFVLWIVACLRAGFSRKEIVASLGLIADGVEENVPILPLSPYEIEVVLGQALFTARPEVLPKGAHWLSTVMSEMPSTPELLLVDRVSARERMFGRDEMSELYRRILFAYLKGEQKPNFEILGK